MKSVHIIFLVGCLLLNACTQELAQQCGSADLNLDGLVRLREGTAALSGPKASLVMPNPLDATRSLQALADSPALLNYTALFPLTALSSSSRLENTFIKIRRNSTTQAATVFSGDFDFSPDTAEYAESMAYYSTTAMLLYVEALGFTVNRKRPLYVLTNAPGQYEGDINAYYEHNQFESTLPRIIHLVGDGDFSPAIDRDMYWHEFGHLVNESVTFDRGLDLAGARGAAFTEGSALHECLADYAAESVGNKDFIGKWIARNFDEYDGGKPLRSAIDASASRPTTFTERLLNDGAGKVPERYQVAEICTRVLWEIRSQFTEYEPAKGAVMADRMILSAAGSLPTDASIRDFHQALLGADKQLHCGINQRSIRAAFESRGVKLNPPDLKTPLQFYYKPIGIQEYEDLNGQSLLRQSTFQEADYVYFQIQVSNPNTTTAHNVRVYAESGSPHLLSDVYMQGLGDLAPGQTIQVGLSQGLSVFTYGTSFIMDHAGYSGRPAYQIRVTAENGGESIQAGVLQ